MEESYGRKQAEEHPPGSAKMHPRTCGCPVLASVPSKFSQTNWAGENHDQEHQPPLSDVYKKHKWAQKQVP